MRDNVTEREVGKHIARFILIGLYTGTRHAAICAAATMPAIAARPFSPLPATLTAASAG